MKILILGNGGREHAFAWKCAQSPTVEHIFVAPGNAGTALEPRVSNVSIASTDIPRLLQFVKETKIDLTLVGPEAPLAAGVVDAFQAENLAIFGPTQAAAQLESSKAFSKDFMRRYKIPTADYEVFEQVDAARDYVRNCRFPLVIKADGLAAGKGVVIAHDQQAALEAIDDMLSAHKFAEAGKRIVIEEFLEGQELSFIVICNGTQALPLATSQDHKARDDGDQGPNTGGMGAYSPVPFVTEALQEEIMETVIRPTLHGMQQEGHPYTGFLYAGLMITATGPKVLEYNCRFGDPETQPIMMRLQSDFVALCQAALQHQLNTQRLQWDPRYALGVVMASQGYPDQYNVGDQIHGLEKIGNTAKVFHAGTVLKNNQVCTQGGRVLCVTALAEDVKKAQEKAYEAVKKIHWGQEFYRHDIGWRALN